MANAVITDEECDKTYFCPLCQIEQTTLKLSLRGLCKRAKFDRLYIWNMDNDGNIIYVGEKTSVIFYSKVEKQWVWYDTKDNTSVITSSAPPGSLLLGVQHFDFKGVNEGRNRCGEEGSLQELKLTACDSRQFTCSKGHCIPLESRCDQTIDCADASDEKNCKIVEMKETYNGNIPPFSYDSVNKV